MGELIDKIFLKLDKNYASEFILSYYINNEQEENNDNIRTFIYLGEVKKDNNKFHNMLLKIPENKTIHLKLRQKLRREKLLIPEYFGENEESNFNYSLKEISLNEDEEKPKKNGGREKEKTIGFAAIRVFKWNSILKFSKYKKYNNITLENAAEMLKCSKKTLDHYRDEILKSRGNFDFKKYYKKKMNFLIKYNKEIEKNRFG